MFCLHITSYRYGDANIDEYVHVPVIAPYAAPSTRANSESNLRYVDDLYYCQSNLQFSRLFEASMQIVIVMQMIILEIRPDL